MKTIFASILLIGAFALLALHTGQSQQEGAWERTEGKLRHILVIKDQYFSLSSFNVPDRKFIHTRGGTGTWKDGALEGTIEFDSRIKEEVGKTFRWTARSQGAQLLLTRDGKQERWTLLDDAQGPLAGNWRITGREQNGQMAPIQSGPRKTIKLLSSQRFQWAAINTATGEFFGTGGGTYIFRDGRYAETIDFFSRDSSRVGMTLEFEGRVEGPNWHHSGKSSRGDRISEVWTREKQ